jgi:hypothetical protein
MPFKNYFKRGIIAGANGLNKRFVRRFNRRLQQRLNGYDISVAGSFVHSIHLIQIWEYPAISSDYADAGSIGQ